MTEHLLIGLDSGGSRTNIEVRAGQDGPKLFSCELGDVLSDAVHPSEFIPVLRKIVSPLEMYWQDHLAEYERATVFMSAAGFSAASREEYRLALADVAANMLGGGVTAIGAANDAVSLLLGHDCEGVVIAGTGSNVLLRDGGGQFHQSGGYGWVASDEGSGFWIGLLAIRQACMDLDDDSDSAILVRLLQHYGIRPPEKGELSDKFLDLCVADHRMLGEIAQFASSVCAAAERGDEVSQNIIKAEAEKLADNVARAVRRHFTSDQLASGITLVQNGGLLASEVYRTALEAQVQMRLLSGHAHPANISWQRVRTGLPAALSLAHRLTDDADDLMDLDPGFRPVIIRPAKS